MQPTLKTLACMTIGAVVAGASSAMPVAQQNALVQKYCAVCHNDAHKNGLLSFEHFDAAQADPGVAALILSKLTSGLSLEKVNAAEADPSAAAMLADKMKTGAMVAAGIPPPDSTTQNALVSALSAEAAGASAWTVVRSQNPATQAPILTASILQEAPSATNAAEADMYRLTLTCHADTREAEMLLAWSPGVPETGRAMSAAVDGRALFTYKVEGHEKMGNGSGVTSGPGAVILYASKENSGAPKFAMPLPEQTLTISNLFPDETVVFPFHGLAQTVRQALSKCFPQASAAR